MKNRICTALLIALLPMFTPVAVTAQSMQVIGGGQSARDCYMAATIAAQMHSATKGDIDTCTFALQEISLKLKDRVATLVNRGVIYVALEQYNKAIRDYERAYKLSPDIAEIHVNRGNILFWSGRFAQAVTEYKRAIELNLAQQYIVYYNRGLAYEKMGELDKAEADYRKALELMPGWGPAQNKLNRLLNRIKQG